MIYLDHAATAPLLPEAKDAMAEAMELFGNPSSPHSAGSEAQKRLQKSRNTVADCLGCEPEELLFTSGGTESNALALHGRTGKAFAGAAEHVSVLKNLPHAELLPFGADGTVSLPDAQARIRKGTGLVSVQYANNELGTIQPVRTLGALCHDVGALFHTDAVQAVGHIPIDLRKEPIDLLSLSAHKFGGPVGIGALYRRADTPLFPLFGGGAQERGLRAGTESVLLACGMAAALASAVRSAEAEGKRLACLRDELQTRLQALGGIPNGSGARLPSHLNIRFPGFDAEALLFSLDLLGFCVSAGAACHASGQAPSHVLLAIGLSEEQAKSSLRITLGKNNTKKDILAFCKAMEHLTNKQNI